MGIKFLQKRRDILRYVVSHHVRASMLRGQNSWMIPILSPRSGLIESRPPNEAAETSLSSLETR